MSLPKKGLRTLMIDQTNYGWQVTGNDGWIDLYIESLEVKNGQLLNVKFDYYRKQGDLLDENNSQFKISSGIVKQVIYLGLANGWEPEKRIAVLNLGHVDRKINPFPN